MNKNLAKKKNKNSYDFVLFEASSIFFKIKLLCFGEIPFSRIFLMIVFVCLTQVLHFFCIDVLQLASEGTDVHLPCVDGEYTTSEIYFTNSRPF